MLLCSSYFEKSQHLHLGGQAVQVQITPQNTMLYPKSLNIEKITELKNLRIVHTVPVSDSKTGSWNGASRGE
jgi:hypothetical protein